MVRKGMAGRNPPFPRSTQGSDSLSSLGDFWVGPFLYINGRLGMDAAYKSFRAKYAGACPSCEDDIDKGDMVSFVRTSSGRVVVHEPCAGFDVSEDPEEKDVDHTNPRIVMPRGKTARDRCNGCFMIHSPGQTGCE